MPAWGNILNEIKQSGDPLAILYKYLQDLSKLTGRDVILYSSAWMTDRLMTVSVVHEDVHAFMSATYGLKNDNLDLILHTPGGSSSAAEAIVSYLRQKFKNIRVIVPQAAMSAGTMLACAGDTIVMGKHSSLGPTDPQFLITGRYVSARAILQQHEQIKKECLKYPDRLNLLLPFLLQQASGLLVEYQNAIDRTKELVFEWLYKYMFEGKEKKEAAKIAKTLSEGYKQHAKPISMAEAQELGLKIKALEEDNDFQDAVLSVFHVAAIMHSNGPNIKIVCNQNKGSAFIKAKASS